MIQFPITPQNNIIRLEFLKDQIKTSTHTFQELQTENGTILIPNAIAIGAINKAIRYWHKKKNHSNG